MKEQMPNSIPVSTKNLRSNPDGQTIDYAYDSFGRLSTLTTPTGAITYAYKAGSGQLASIAAPGNINLAYTYDGALLTGVTATGPVPGALTTVYDNFFRASQIGVNGSNIAYAYDADGLLTGAGNMTLARDPGNGLVTGTTLGQLATSQSYDSFGRVSGFTAKQGATVLFDEQYQRDNAGNLTKKTVTLNGQTSVYDYAYDPAGRLTDVTKDGTATGHFEYDANGNRTLAYGIAASYDDQDRLTTFGSAQYAYTANGELRQVTNSSGTTGYEYDVTGNLKHVDLPDSTALDYLADGRNRRVGKKVNGTLVQGFLYQDQLKPAAELDAQGNVVSRFVYAGKANVPDYLVKGGVTYRILGDQLGSVRLVVDSATGQIAQRIDYDEWGNVLSDSNPGFQPFGYAGGLYDRDTGLVRFGARDYDPWVGRWTVKDPIGFAGGDTSLYNYVDGNPLRYTDPLGLANSGWMPSRSKPIPKPTTRPDGLPWGAGCGDKGTDCYVPDSIGGGDFRQACIHHDNCFATPGASYETCNERLGQDMALACRLGNGNGFCSVAAQSYPPAIRAAHTIMDLIGVETPFDAAQREGALIPTLRP